MKSDYKEAQAAIEKLKAGDARGVEPALHFLKTDIYEFRSGYLKEQVWRHLHRASLAEHQRASLLQIARKYLQRRMTREFWQMCRLVSQIADAEFTENIQHLAESAKDPDVRQRASLLRAYLQGVEEGEKERLRFKRLVR